MHERTLRTELQSINRSLTTQIQRADVNLRLATDAMEKTLFGIEDEAGDLLQAGIDWNTVQPFETAILEADALRARTRLIARLAEDRKEK